MSFSTIPIEKDKPYINEQKQHLNLSHFANTVIENDMETFGFDKRSTFINQIFTNFYEEAQSSISRSLEAEKNRLDILIRKAEKTVEESNFKDHLKLSEEDINWILRQFSEKILEQKSKDLVKQAKSYEKGPSFKFRINDTNFQYLTNLIKSPPRDKNCQKNKDCQVDKGCQEDKYYDDKIGKYIKALIEEYCRLPLFRRSEICFRDIIHKVQTACDKGKVLEVHFRPSHQRRIPETKIHPGRPVKIHPYGIETDPTSGYPFLIGYYDSDGPSKTASDRIASFRLSKIKDVKIRRRNSFISTEKRRRLEKAVREKGYAYINKGTARDIEVFLTRQGKDKYKNQPVNRPVVKSINGDIYTFHCTSNQIFVYFFNFGKEARIIRPAGLAALFQEAYEKSAAQY